MRSFEAFNRLPALTTQELVYQPFIHVIEEASAPSRHHPQPHPFMLLQAINDIEQIRRRRTPILGLASDATVHIDLIRQFAVQ